MSDLSFWPLRLSARDAAGHDSGRVHIARLTQLNGAVAACGARFGTNGTVSHDIGPTCRKCRALL